MPKTNEDSIFQRILINFEDFIEWNFTEIKIDWFLGKCPNHNYINSKHTWWPGLSDVGGARAGLVSFI